MVDKEKAKGAIAGLQQWAKLRNDWESLARDSWQEGYSQYQIAELLHKTRAQIREITQGIPKGPQRRFSVKDDSLLAVWVSLDRRRNDLIRTARTNGIVARVVAESTGMSVRHIVRISNSEVD